MSDAHSLRPAGPRQAVSPAYLNALADEIDHRLSPIPGWRADDLAVALREAAAAIAGLVHPTGSEQFAAILVDLGVPAPWRPGDEFAGEILAANGEPACEAFANNNALATTLALWIELAINTLAGFRAVVPGTSP